jgi:hypothetical protein
VIKPTLIPIEGPKSRPEGGEWKPIKIIDENSTYVPKSTLRASLLTQSSSYSYWTSKSI